MEMRMIAVDVVRRMTRAGCAATVLAACWALPGRAEPPQPRPPLNEPVFRVNRQPDQDPTQKANALEELAQAQPGEHPLAPAIRMAKLGLRQIDTNIKDYKTTVVKREEID